MRNLTVGVAITAAVLSVSGCTSEASTDTAENSTTSVSDTTTAPAAAAVPAPTSAELEASLDQLVAPDVDAQIKADAVENGQARVANLGAMTAALANYGAISFEVGEPTVSGETSSADVAIATPRGTAAPSPYSWVLIDGQWKISDASTCVLLAMGQAPCV